MDAVRAGYQRTEVGDIPEGWTVHTLGELGETLIGLTYRPEDVAPEGTLVLRSSNIEDGQLALDDCIRVRSVVPSRIMVRDGDILVCVRNGSRGLIGKSLRLDNQVRGMTFGAFMSVYRSELSEFLCWHFQSGAIKKQIDEHLGATINQITSGNLNRFLALQRGSR